MFGGMIAAVSCAACATMSASVSAMALASGSSAVSMNHHTRYCDIHKKDVNGNPREGHSTDGVTWETSGDVS